MSPRFLLKLTIITPAKQASAASAFCQFIVSIPMQMLIAVATIGAEPAVELAPVKADEFSGRERESGERCEQENPLHERHRRVFLNQRAEDAEVESEEDSVENHQDDASQGIALGS